MAAVNGLTEVSPGIHEIKYELPGGDAQLKTVYDPAKYSDAQMADMASEAASKGLMQYQLGGQVIQRVEVNGVAQHSKTAWWLYCGELGETVCPVGVSSES